jgi:hypothetical protein
MKYIYIILSVLLVVSLSGCYTDTVDSLKTFVIQVPLNQDMINFGNSKETSYSR